jgi:hypothetical protein
VSRSDAARRLLRAGLEAEGPPASTPEPVTWEQAAARLEAEYPQRWGPLADIDMP